MSSNSATGGRYAARAEHLGKGIIERDIEAKVPDKSTELILYCGGGYRSEGSSQGGRAAQGLTRFLLAGVSPDRAR